MRNQSELDIIAVIMKAMAHPTRLFIIRALDGQEHCVCELTEMVGIDQSTMSKHLSILKNAGIVEGRKENNQVYYRLIRPCLLDVMQCVMKKS
ncbi:MAG: metalloregulator ArsR/SmtB family transcription factor [Candidatus Cloacimonetes bacterium]|nr:metalloregulator ArsR/SmtB family transcription factor [Candidatus Cloacimonadota bacterium]